MVDCSAVAKRSDFNQFHSHPSGHWIKSFCHSINQLLAQGTRVELRWSKAHTGFRGHEIAGAFAKWASLAILLSSFRLPPPPKGNITFQGIPLLGQITQKFYSNIHMHNDIKLHESFDWFNLLALELAVQMVRRHFLHQGSQSALQNAKTPMSCMPSTFIQAWPEQFHSFIHQWWQSPPSAGHRRNFIRTLMPVPLYNHLLKHTGLSKKHFKKITVDCT